MKTYRVALALSRDETLVGDRFQTIQAAGARDAAVKSFEQHYTGPARNIPEQVWAFVAEECFGQWPNGLPRVLHGFALRVNAAHIRFQNPIQKG